MWFKTVWLLLGSNYPSKSLANLVFHPPWCPFLCTPPEQSWKLGLTDGGPPLQVSQASKQLLKTCPENLTHTPHLEPVPALGQAFMWSPCLSLHRKGNKGKEYWVLLCLTEDKILLWDLQLAIPGGALNPKVNMKLLTCLCFKQLPCLSKGRNIEYSACRRLSKGLFLLLWTVLCFQ